MEEEKEVKRKDEAKEEEEEVEKEEEEKRTKKERNGARKEGGRVGEWKHLLLVLSASASQMRICDKKGLVTHTVQSDAPFLIPITPRAPSARSSINKLVSGRSGFGWTCK